jgi:hypothetical protein
VASIPAVKALEERHHSRGLRVIGVTRTGQDEEERKYTADTAKKHGMTSPTFIDDPNGTWAKEANITPMPGFLLIDRQGKIAYRYAGKLEQGSDAFEAMSKLVEKM